MTNLLGAPVIVGAEDIQFPDDYVVVERGGLHCVWTDPAEKGGQLVNLVVLPAAAVPVPTTKPYDCSAGGADEPSVCYFAVAHSGYFVSGILGTPTHRSAQALTALAKRLVSEVNTAASAAGVPPTVTADGGAWTKPASCKALDSAAGATAASGNPALRVNTGDVGSDLPNGYYLALDSSPYLGCVWTMNATPPKGKLGGFMISLAPGGAWAKSTAVTSASVAVTIDGADAAYSTSDADGIRRVDVFDGANWLQVQPYGSAISVGQVAPVVTALLRSLDR